MKAVILADGEFPTRKELLTELKKAQFLAVCDGAIAHLEKLGISPNVIVGDLDSISLKLKEKYAKKIVHVTEQVTNDLSKAFHHCLSLGFDEFVILGATGKREDHTLGNISLLVEFVKHSQSVVIKSDYGEFRIYSLPCEISSQKGEQISLFCLNPDLKITSRYLKYPLKSLTLPLWASGTLNEAEGDFFILEGNQEEKVILYRAYQ